MKGMFKARLLTVFNTGICAVVIAIAGPVLSARADYSPDLMRAGEGCLSQQRYAEAAEYFRVASESQPNNAEIHYWYATALAKEFKGQMAMAQYTICLQLNPSPLLAGYCRQALTGYRVGANNVVLGGAAAPPRPGDTPVPRPSGLEEYAPLRGGKRGLPQSGALAIPLSRAGLQMARADQEFVPATVSGLLFDAPTAARNYQAAITEAPTTATFGRTTPVAGHAAQKIAEQSAEAGDRLRYVGDSTLTAKENQADMQLFKLQERARRAGASYTDTGTGSIPSNSTAFHYARLQDRLVDLTAQDASQTAFENYRKQENLQNSAHNLQDLLQSEPAKSSTVIIQPLGTNLYVRNYQTFGN